MIRSFVPSKEIFYLSEGICVKKNRTEAPGEMEKKRRNIYPFIIEEMGDCFHEKKETLRK
jgi:hypothetical protein